MTHHTDAEQERAEFDLYWLDRQRKRGFGQQLTDKEMLAYPERRADEFHAWQAARRAPAVPVPQIDPVHGDCLPPIGSRVFIRHGRDDDAHACIVTGYYAWGDLKGSKHLHRVFVQMVYEGTDTKQARMLCDCYATAEDALAAASQPPEANPVELHQIKNAAPVQIPDALLTLETDAHYIFNNPPCECPQSVRDVIEWYAASIRELLAAHGIK